MNSELAGALARLGSALDRLDGSVARFFDVEARRSDIETELGVMQEDRARLAAELETSTARLARVEAAAEHVGQRVGNAIASIRTVVAQADAAADETARG